MVWSNVVIIMTDTKGGYIIPPLVSVAFFMSLQYIN